MACRHGGVAERPVRVQVEARGVNDEREGVKNVMKYSLRLAILLVALGGAASADEAPLLWKTTLSLYEAAGDHSYDANVRYKTERYAAWVGTYVDARTRQTQLRLGSEYDFARDGVLMVPSLQVATHGLVAGALYGELGPSWFAVVGASRTNLRPFFNLTFDPNESLQLGVGRAMGSADRVTAFSIFDVRLHTGQQNTHLIWRHRARGRRVTLDALFKSGETDARRYVRAFGGTVTYDFPRWFLRFAYDPYANFGEERMLRLSVGWRM